MAEPDANQPPAQPPPPQPSLPPPEGQPPAPQEQQPARVFTKEELKAALKAFNKRLRLTRLDDESRLGYGAMTGGEKSAIMGIRPPDQFPKAMWDELVKQGKLRYEGQGLYGPVE